jgi:hypothetical protein
VSSKDEAARLTAEREAARIPWPQLQKARENYVAWEAFVLWLRAIEEGEGHFPEWLAKIVEKRCRGFSKFRQDHIRKHSDAKAFVWRQLERWVHERIFGKAWREGWVNAVGYYALKSVAPEP